MSESIDLKSATSKLQCLICSREYIATDGLKNCPEDQSLLCPIAEDKLVNSILDNKYEILKIIGVGGFGRVYKARHLYMDKIVAIKVMTGNFMLAPELLGRFKAEAIATNKLAHTNIVGTLDHGADPQPYLVMEYVDGETLECKIKNQGALHLDEFLRIFEQVCQAMNLAHQMGYLHRDLKPSNIMIDAKTGEAKVLDFGLVKMQGENFTRTGEVIGSPPYMSPEQCKGMELDERTDVYSIGCVMYEALTGLKAFEGKTAADTMYRHFNTTPPSVSSLRKGFPKALDYVTGRALADISNRYETVEQLRLDLAKAGAGSLNGRLRKFSRPTYRKTIKTLARIATVGNWTIIIAFLILLVFH